MRSRKREAIFMGIGILVGLALRGPAAQAADYLTARPTTQTFYINGQQAPLTAYLIGGSNYIRLRDVGKAVNFGVTYDAATNTVYIDSTQPYQEESAPTTSALSEKTVRAAILELKKSLPSRCRISNTLPPQKSPPPLHQLRPLRGLGHAVLRRRLRRPPMASGG